MKNYIIISILIGSLTMGFLIWGPDRSTGQIHETGQNYQDTIKMEKRSEEPPKKSDTSGEEEGEEVVRLSSDELKEFNIVLATAKKGSLEQYKDLPGEIVLNADRLAHVVPRVGSIVREVKKTVGESVKAGDVLAILDSRELADAKSAFLSSIEREKLAQSSFSREEILWQKKVTSEQEFLDARQSLAEARIARKSSSQQLRSLGFTDTQIKELSKYSDTELTRLMVRAPFAGTIIEKHLTLGESVNSDTEIFTIADLSSVWVDINVYQKDLVNIHKGQDVTIETGHGIPTVSGKIAWISPIVGEETRTAKARVILTNTDGKLRPGLFVTAKVSVGNLTPGVLVSKNALQTFENRTVIFVKTKKGYEPIPVETGRENNSQVEILAGLEIGQTYVDKGSFTLKAQLSKAAFGDGHGH